jgi:hypothetical protein
MINKDFEKWAKGYSGFDGGNPNAKIWLCGIEWGGNQTENLEDLQKDFQNDVSKIPMGYDNHNENLDFPYNYKFLKVMAAAKGIDFLANGSDSKKIKQILKDFNDKEKHFTKESNYLKLNIFPLQFQEDKNSLWTKVYKDATGFETKNEYRKWCLEKGRFELFQNMIRESAPSLIITTGSTSRNYYIEAFGFKDFELQSRNLKYDTTKNIYYAYDYDKDIMFLNIPFLGRPLNSNKILMEVGELIANDLIFKYDLKV